MAIPRGLELASVSGMLGMPVELEKRTMRGVEGLWKWGAVESEAASAVGVKVPVTSCPFACATDGLGGCSMEFYIGGLSTWSVTWMVAKCALQRFD